MEQFITPQRLVEQFELTEQDILGVDLQEFIETYELTEERAKIFKMKNLLESHKRRLQREKKERENPIRDIWDESTAPAMQLNKIVWFVVNEHKGTLSETIIFNFETPKAYYTYGAGNHENEFGAGKVTALKEEKVRKIHSIIENFHVAEWRERYHGKDIPGSTGHYVWGVAFKFKDGTVKNFRGGGLRGINAPEDFHEFVLALRAIAKGE